MNREDIALTVGGVLATMALAYMFYRMQQRDAAASSAAQADAIAAQDSSPAADPYNTQLTEEWLASNLTQASGAALTGLSSNTAASNPTSSAVSDLGAPFDSTDTGHLFSDIVSAYSGAPSPLNVGATITPGLMEMAGASSLNLDGSQLSALPSPTIATTPNIPMTAADATAQAEAALPASSSTYGSWDPANPPLQNVPIYSAGGPNGPPSLNFSSFLGAMQSSASTSSHPVTAHPILSIGG